MSKKKKKKIHLFVIITKLKWKFYCIVQKYAHAINNLRVMIWIDNEVMLLVWYWYQFLFTRKKEIIIAFDSVLVSRNNLSLRWENSLQD